MILWYCLLILFAFLSLLIDLDYLRPQVIFRQLWNLSLLGMGIYLLVRMRVKMRDGANERLQKEYSSLCDQMEAKRWAGIQERVAALEGRMGALEGKK